MTTTFIISEAKIREFTTLNEMVDSALIKNGIRVASDVHLQRIIGTKLYDSILSQIDAGPTWTNSNYQNLVDKYIQDFLLYAAYYEILEAVMFRPRNNGLLSPTGGDNSEKVDVNTYDKLRQSALNKMEFYGDRLSNYIAEEQGLFPELNENSKLYEQWPDYGSQYRSPIVFNRNVKVGAHYWQAKEAGLRITDSRYKQYPWGSNVE